MQSICMAYAIISVIFNNAAETLGNTCHGLNNLYFKGRSI